MYYITVMFRMLTPCSIMNFVMFITPVFPWKFLSKAIEPGNHGYPTGWMKSIKTKNKLYRRYKKTGNAEHESIYKQYRNNLNRLLITAEKIHYETLFNDNKDDLKKSWRILKQVINKRKYSSSCSKFLVNQETTTDKNKIAKGFNQYLINIGPNLANKIPRIISVPRHTWITGFLKAW